MNVQSEGGGNEGTQKLANNQMVRVSSSSEDGRGIQLSHPTKYLVRILHVTVSEKLCQVSDNFVSAPVSRMVSAFWTCCTNVATPRDAGEANCLLQHLDLLPESRIVARMS